MTEGSTGSLTAEHLRCEYLVNPLGIDETARRLNWVLRSERRGQVQGAYQILVASTVQALGEGRANLWDSGRVRSDQNMRETYQRGIPLQRLGVPEDIKGLVVFLASDASAFITGAAFPLDGGNTAMGANGTIGRREA